MSLLSRLERVRDKDASVGSTTDPNTTPAAPPSDVSSTDAVEARGGLTNESSSSDAFDPFANASIHGSLGPDALDTPAGGGGNFLAGTAADAAVLVSPGNGNRNIADPSEKSSTLAGDAETTLAHMPEDDRRLRTLYRDKYLIFDDVLGSLDPRIVQQPQRQSVRSAIEKALESALPTHDIALDRAAREWMIKEFVSEIMDFGPITPYLDDPAIGKIIISNAQDVAVERLGQLEQSPVTFRDDDHLLMLIRRVADLVQGRIDTKVPLLDRPLPGGARVRAKMAPLSPRPALTVEKGSGNPFEAIRRKGEQKSTVQPYAQLRERIQQKLVQNLDARASSAANPDALRAQVEEMINQVIQEERIALTRAERASLITDLINEIIGLGPIEPLLSDPEVDEVMVNGPNLIYAERKGKLELSPYRFRDNAHVLQVIDRIVAPLGRRVDEKSPMVDARLRDGSRVNAIIPPLSLGGPTLTIRKFARDPFTMTDLINFGSLTREAAQFLQACVEARLNILISGGTGSGKTTTLNVLSSFIPSNERIVTIEDAAELQLRQEHVVRLETRPPNIEGVGEISIRDLVRNSLRMRPDRIVVGECRGPEALDMLQAMNTGHDGSLTTGHSNAPRDMLKRLETMVLMSGFDLPVRAIREQISMAIHIIVHQDRMRDGTRRITHISEIVGMEGEVITMQDLFRFEQEFVDDSGKIHGSLQPTGMRPKHDEEILRSGIKLPLDLFQPKNIQQSTRGRVGMVR
jgi:pilus assembly protein CpaF